MENIGEDTRSIVTQHGLTRLKYLIPNAFTLGSVFCGCYAVINSLSGFSEIANPQQAADFFNRAAGSIGLAIALDNLDGRIARMIGATSDFGIELDSIADALTFGGATAVLSYTWGYNLTPELKGLAFFVSFIFLSCGALRLARSSMRARSLSSAPGDSGAREERFFVGLPIPAAAGMVAALVYFFSSPVVNELHAAAASNRPGELRFYSLTLLGVMLILSLLMVSTLKYSKLKIRYSKAASLPAVLNRMVFPLIAVVLSVGFWFSSRWLVLAIAVLYAAHGPFLKIFRRD